MADEAVEQEETVEEGSVVSRLEEGRYLPPIHRIRMPKTVTQTAKVKWLYELGYPVKVISNGLGIRYQQVRNMVTTVPKRASREDLPPLELELLELEDNVDMLLDAELDRTFAESRQKKGRSKTAPKDGKPSAMHDVVHEHGLNIIDDDEVDEITEIED